jgi:putative membrane protein
MKFKISVIILLSLLLVIFALQNIEIVDIKLWFWGVKTPRALLILLCIAMGVIIGMIASRCNFKKIKKEANIEDEHL